MALRGFLTRREAILFRRDTGDITPAPVSGYEFRQFHPPAFEDAPLFSARDRAARFRARLSEGHRCFGFVDAEGAPSAYLWFTRPGAGNVVPIGGGVRLEPGGGDAYVWDCRTVEAAQGNGLYRTGLQSLAALAGSEGARHVWIDCAPDNAGSIAGIRRAGFNDVLRWQVVRAGPVRIFLGRQGPCRIGVGPLKVPLTALSRL
mgnify:CR=1 FL=1